MKKNILLVVTSFLVVMSAHAQPQDWCVETPCCYEDNNCTNNTSFYAKIFGGANFLQNTHISENRCKYETGYVVAGSLGYSWRYGLRVEGEYAYRNNAIKRIHFFTEGSSKHGHLDTSSYMANVFFDLPLSACGCSFWNIGAFIGAGVGYDFHQMHARNSRIVFKQKWNHFSWQLMAGLSYPIFRNTELTLEYKFHQGGSRFNNHAVGAGLAYKFNFR
jgi:opacity protein-like surface antigen